MAVVLTNNAETTLASGVLAAGTSITVAAGQGALFPNPGASDWFPLLLIKADGSAYEIVRGVSRAGDGISIERAREGTTAIDFVTGDIVSHRATAEALQSLASSSSTDVPQSTSGGVNKYIVSLPDVSAYADGLRVSFRAHVASSGAVTLQVNSLAEIDIVTDAGAPIAAADIATNQVVEAVYDSGTGDFIIDHIRFPTSSISEAGYAQRGTDEDFDINGDNANFTTQRTASRIANDAVQTALAAFAQSQIPTAYANTGNAAGGNNTVSTSQSFAAGRELQYRNLTVSSGGTMNMIERGVLVIRCTEKFLLEAGSEINVQRCIVGDHAREFVGPGGGTTPPTPGTNTVRNATPPNGVLGAAGQSLGVEDFAGAVLNNMPLHMWHGGHGSADNTLRLPLEAGGGLIIIADEVEFEAGADINGLHGLAGSGFQAASGGGVVMVCANTFIHPTGVQYEAGLLGNKQGEIYWQNVANANNADPEAANGTLLFLDLSTASFSVIF